MASSINASTSGAGGVITTADNTGILNLQTSGTTAVTVDASQNVGIGTASPASKLNLQGSSVNYTTYSVSGTNKAYVGVDNGTPELVSGATAGDLVIRSNQSTLFGLTGGGFAMKIDSSGNVLVGKTSQITDELFGVDQTNTSRPAIIARAATTGSPSFKSVKVTNVNNTTQYHMTFAYNNGANGNGAIVGNGDSQAAFASFSDSRLKKNIEDLPSQLDKITSLRPVEFDYIKSGEHQIGFIAQEVKEVYPDLVAEGEDEMLTVTGLGKTEARLIKAIQELKAIVDAQQQEINALKGAAL